jgi:hypothetical protein
MSVAVTIMQISDAANKGGCEEAIGGIEKQKELSEEEFLGKEARTQPPLSPSPPSTHAHASTQMEPSIFEDTRSESPQCAMPINWADEVDSTLFTPHSTPRDFSALHSSSNKRRNENPHPRKSEHSYDVSYP